MGMTVEQLRAIGDCVVSITCGTETLRGRLRRERLGDGAVMALFEHEDVGRGEFVVPLDAITKIEER